MKHYVYSNEDMNNFIEEWQKEKTSNLSYKNALEGILNLWDDFIDDKYIYGMFEENKEKREITEKELFEILENGEIEEFQIDTASQVIIDNKVYFVINGSNYLEKRIYKFLKNREKNFWLVSFNEDNFIYAVNLTNKSYDDLRKDNLDFYFTGKSFDVVLTIKDYTFKIENKKILEKLFEKYPELKMEYLKMTKKIVDEHQSIIDRVSKRKIYELTEEDQLIMEVLE